MTKKIKIIYLKIDYAEVDRRIMPVNFNSMYGTTEKKNGTKKH